MSSDPSQPKDFTAADYGFTNYSMSRGAGDLTPSDENAGNKGNAYRFVVMIGIGACLLGAAITGIVMLMRRGGSAPVTSRTYRTLSTSPTYTRFDEHTATPDAETKETKDAANSSDPQSSAGHHSGNATTSTETLTTKALPLMEEAMLPTDYNVFTGSPEGNNGSANPGVYDDWRRIFSEVAGITYESDDAAPNTTINNRKYTGSFSRTKTSAANLPHSSLSTTAVVPPVIEASFLITADEPDNDTRVIEEPADLKNRTLRFDFPRPEKCLICTSEASRLKQLISPTKAPCNDFYDFVCGRFSRTFSLHGSLKLVTSSIDQHVIISKSVEGKLLRLLTENKEKGWAHQVIWNSCTSGMQGSAYPANAMRQLLLEFGLEGWPYSGREHFTEQMVARAISVLARQLGLNALFAVGLVSLTADEQARYYYSVDEPDLILRTCNTISPTREVSWYMDLVHLGLLSLSQNGTNVIDTQESIFRVSCNLAKAVSRREERSYRYKQTIITSLMSMSTLVMPIQMALQDVAVLSMDASVATRNPAFVDVLQSILQPENYVSLMNYMGFRVLIHLTAVTSVGRDEFLSAVMQRLTGWRQKSWDRSTVCLRLVENLVPELLLFSYYKHYFSSTDIGMKHLLIDAAMDSVLQLSATSPWGINNSYSNTINRTLSVLKVNRFLPSWLLAFKERWFFNRQVLRGVGEGSFLRIYVNVRTNIWQMFLNKTVRSRLERWDASVFDTMAVYNSEENYVYIPMAMFGIEDSYDIPLSNESSLLYAAFVFWKIQYAFAPTFTALALKERSRSSRRLNVQTSFNIYNQCIIKQYKVKVDKDVRLHLNAENTFLTDNRDIFAAVRSPPPRGASDDGETFFPRYTLKQLYYIYYALGRCEIHNTDHITEIIETGDFSPPRYRVNIPLRNSKDFRETWGCKPPSCKLKPEG